MPEDSPDAPRTYLALSAAAVFWGLSFVGTKVALETLPTFTVVFGRFGLASLLFLLLMTRRGFPRFTAGEHGKLFLTALFEPGLYFIFETVGLQYTTAPKAALIIATIPLAVMLFAGLILGERPSPGSLVGIFVSLAGIGVLITGDPDFSWNLSGPLFGDLMVIGAVVTAALYIVLARDLGRSHSALSITSLQILYGALFYAPAFLWELPEIAWGSVSARSLAALLYLTLFATVAAFLCYNHGLTKVSASRASVFINCIPVVTAVGAWLILGETLTPVQMGGGALVLLAVFVANLPGLGAKERGIERTVTGEESQGFVSSSTL